MLKQRLMTAAVLIPLVVLSILFLSTASIQWILAAVSLLAAWEWFSIMGFNGWSKMSFAMVLLVFIAVLSLFLPLGLLLVFTTLMWSAIVVFVARFAHKPLSEKSRQFFTQPMIALTMASIVLTVFWYCSVQLHASSELGPQQLLYVMVLVWLADTGGYFAGKRWGKRKLAKSISPNKTWEGVAGAVVLGSVWALIGFSFELSGPLGLLTWLFLSAITLLISVVGDLFESLFKRCHNVKDSGNLLPGHGGILDRIDSLIAAVPVFLAGLYFLGAV